MEDTLKRNPHGWTAAGMATGWIRPQRMPQDGKLKKLATENAELRERLARLEAAMLGEMESSDGR